MSRLQLSALPDRWRKIGANTGWLLLGRVIPQGLSLLFAVLIARHYGEVGFGVITWITAVTFLGNIVSTFGMDTEVIRLVAAQPSETDRVISRAIVLQLLIAVIVIAIFGLILTVIPIRHAPLLFLSLLSLVPLAITTGFNAGLRGQERMRPIFWLNGLTAAVQVTGAALFIQLNGSLLGIVGMIVASRVIESAAAVWLYCRSNLKFDVAWPGSGSWPYFKTMIQRGAPLMGLMLVAILYQRMSTLIAAAAGGDAIAGLWGGALRLIEAGKLIPYALFGALFPAAMRTGQTRLSLSTPMRTLMLLMIVGSIVTTLIGPWLIEHLFGVRFIEAGRALQIGIWALIPFLISLHLSFDLVTRHYDRAAFWATGATLLASIPILRAGYLVYGLNGLACGFVAAEWVHAGLLKIAQWRVR